MGFLCGIAESLDRHPQAVKTVLMLNFLLLGLLTAAGHHVYYCTREGQLARDQQFHLKVGTGLAFLTRAMLSAAVAIALTQIVWRTVRQRAFTLVGLDKLFALAYSPSNLLSWELMRSATVVAIVAICFWLIPFAAIAPPGTLTVRGQSYVTYNSSLTVPTFDFQALAKSGKQANGKSTLALSAGPGGTLYQDSYSGPTVTAIGHSMSVAYGQMLTPPSPCGANCHYNIKFTGPTLKCVKLKDWNDPSTPWYNATEGGRLFDRRIQYNGTSVGDSFWAAWAYLPHESFNNGSFPTRDPTLSSTTMNEDFVLSAVKCDAYNATFNVKVSYTSNQGRMDILGLTDIKPMNFSATPPYFLDPTEFADYGDLFMSHAIFDTLFDNTVGIISGVIGESGTVTTTTYYESSNIVHTKLTEKWLYSTGAGSGGMMMDALYPVKDLGAAIEELYNNVTLSLIARPDIVYSNTTRVPATLSGTRNIFAYDRRDLWLSYGAAIIVSAAIVALGLFSLWSSRDAHDTAFTSILLASSNPHLDGVLMGAQTESGRNSEAVRHLKDVKLQYSSRSEEGHYATDGPIHGFVIVQGGERDEKGISDVTPLKSASG